MGPAALLILVFFALWAALRLLGRRVAFLRPQWVAPLLAAVLTVAALKAFEYGYLEPKYGGRKKQVGEVQLRTWKGIDEARASAVVPLLKGARRVAVWRNGKGICVRGQVKDLPGAAPDAAALQRAYGTADPICGGYELTNGRTTMAACTRPDLWAWCGHSVLARDFP